MIDKLGVGKSYKLVDKEGYFSSNSDSYKRHFINDIIELDEVGRVGDGWIGEDLLIDTDEYVFFEEVDESNTAPSKDTPRPLSGNKLLILGYGGHGKDEFAERLCKKLNLKFISSSKFLCSKVVYPWFQDNFPDLYNTSEECYLDRRNWRALWKNLLSQYNKDDKTRLARELLAQNDVYVGMRCPEELDACIEADLFRYVIWVGAEERVSREDESSCGVEFDDDYMLYVNNDGSLGELDDEVEMIYSMLEHDFVKEDTNKRECAEDEDLLTIIDVPEEVKNVYREINSKFREVYVGDEEALPYYGLEFSHDGETFWFTFAGERVWIYNEFETIPTECMIKSDIRKKITKVVNNMLTQLDLI